MGWIRKLFLIAALLNLGLGLALFMPGLLIGGVFGAQNLPNEAIGSFYLSITFWLVIGFGLLYFAPAINPGGNRPIMLVGGIAKIGVFFIALGVWRAGVLGTLLFGVTVVDLIQGILFIIAFFKSVED